MVEVYWPVHSVIWKCRN